MNKQRRQQIKLLTEKLQEALEMAENICGEERDYMESIPENMQSGERYEAASEAVDCLESACCEIESALSSLDGVG